MKKLFLILLVLAIVFGLYLVAQYIKQESDKAYQDCLAAGKQSNETCYYYAYIQ